MSITTVGNSIMSISLHRIIPGFDGTSTIGPFLVALVAITLVLYSLYQWLLPRPVPGIAYNPKATKSLLGDAPSMIEEVSVTGEFRVWCTKQVKQIDSPICQVFIRPFSKPWILLADFRESKDILMRRREFNKSSFLADGMACMGSFHGIYPTGDKFKSNRQLIQDLMTTSFLNDHVGPTIYNKALDLMKLFEFKMGLANGRPFSVKKDFEYASLDVMLEFAFGKTWVHTATGPQVELLSKLRASDVKVDALDQPVNFPAAPFVDFLRSVYEAPEIVEETINAIFATAANLVVVKAAMVAIGVKNYHAGHVKTGIEHMLMREGSRAEKEGRRPDFESKVFRDELRSIRMFGDIVGGHHKTSGAMMWLAKYLTNLPQIQTKLHSVLYETLLAVKEENRLFTLEEIRRAKLPYLDAVIEEMLRINAVTVTREAL
ncbi:MAG: hypothetical protein Q9210_005164 [Variospora velana]